MADTSATSLDKNNPPSQSPPEGSPQIWYKPFSRTQNEEGKKSWQDATLSDKKRWKEWQKAKDKERVKGSTTGYLTTFYKEKGGWAWWVGLFGS